MAIPKCSAFPVARMSMGFETEEPGRSMAFSSSAKAPVMGGTFMFPFDKASVNITPGPPAWVTMAKFLPVKRGRVKIQPTVVNSSREKHLTIPALRNNASASALAGACLYRGDSTSLANQRSGMIKHLVGVGNVLDV